ncbi:MAG: GGDEF domain-containing protein, partial [Cycloclasticus sp.]|nr:GGDEF domain-containing protein [Cycloclasticus sp.]
EITKLKTELALVKEAAEQDALTGLKNRGAFDQKMKRVMTSNEATEVTLIIIDIDHFKRINDNFGHLVGDRVIRYISSLMTQLIEEKHFISRYGGEEFTVILEGVSAEDTQLLANKVRIAMANSKLQRKGSHDTLGQVTLSAGIASLSVKDDAESFIARADKALYQAKETGRNKVVFLT